MKLKLKLTTHPRPTLQVRTHSPTYSLSIGTVDVGGDATLEGRRGCC